MALRLSIYKEFRFKECKETRNTIERITEQDTKTGGFKGLAQPAEMKEAVQGCSRLGRVLIDDIRVALEVKEIPTPARIVVASWTERITSCGCEQVKYQQK